MQEKIEANKQASRLAEISFREKLKDDFVKANNFATESDFERLYSTLRDAKMIENLREYTKERR